MTPLHWAVDSDKNIDIVKFLVSKGANANVTDKLGNTPLDRARKGKDGKQAEEIVEYLTNLVAEENRIADEKLEEKIKPDLERAVDLNAELRKSGFSNLRDSQGRFERLADFAKFGNAKQKNDLEKIEKNPKATDAAKDRVKMNVRTAQANIAKKVFVTEYPFSISSHNMKIATGFECSRIEKNLFSVQDVTGSFARSDSTEVQFALAGSKDNIRILEENKNEYLAKVWFKNLRQEGRYSFSISADIVKVEIVKKPE